MMPINESETVSREDLDKLRRKSKCKECGARLNMYLDQESGLAFLACWDWHRTHHDGIEREASRYEQEGLEALTIKARREMMNQEYGEEKTKALAKLPMSGALTQPQAMHILKLVYPNVPEDQIIRTAILCRDFGLHPLMKEVYIIGFKNSKTGKTEHSTVIGIGATRKMSANKKGAYSYIDDTPRAATQQEVVKQYGEDSEEDRDNLISICKLKGVEGNEAIGFGLWPKEKTPYGTDKGNTKRNMGNIRSERQALGRLPGEALPQLEVIDEAYAEVPDVGVVDEVTGEIIEGEATVLEEDTKAVSSPLPETQSEPQPKLDFDPKWLTQSLNEVKWTDATVKSYLKNMFKVDTSSSVVDVVGRLTREQREQFFGKIQEGLDKLKNSPKLI